MRMEPWVRFPLLKKACIIHRENAVVFLFFGEIYYGTRGKNNEYGI